MVYKFFDKKTASLVDRSTASGVILMKLNKTKIVLRITQTNY